MLAFFVLTVLMGSADGQDPFSHSTGGYADWDKIVEPLKLSESPEETALRKSVEAKVAKKLIQTLQEQNPNHPQAQLLKEGQFKSLKKNNLLPKEVVEEFQRKIQKMARESEIKSLAQDISKQLHTELEKQNDLIAQYVQSKLRAKLAPTQYQNFPMDTKAWYYQKLQLGNGLKDVPELHSRVLAQTSKEHDDIVKSLEQHIEETEKHENAVVELLDAIKSHPKAHDSRFGKYMATAASFFTLTAGNSIYGKFYKKDFSLSDPENVLLLGIGGSVLLVSTLYNYCSPFRNAVKKCWKNTTPETKQALESTLRLTGHAVNWVAQYSSDSKWYQERIVPMMKQLTDKQKEALKEFAPEAYKILNQTQNLTSQSTQSDSYPPIFSNYQSIV